MSESGDRERWKRVKEIFDAAVACRVEERAALVRDLCGDDHALHADVESLLVADGGDGMVFEPRVDRVLRGRVFDVIADALEDETRALTPGDCLGGFEIIGFLGAGGMGRVYRARDTRLKREVAIKVLPEAFARHPETLTRFKREAEVLASLNHPNIAHIHDLEEADGRTALVMELVEGATLEDRIALGAIPLDEALQLARQIADALEAAHEQGIIHRDLKPANIKIKSDATVKVLDFGLAKAIEVTAGLLSGGSRTPAITTAGVTQAGMILGTAAYMSPEQARGRTVDRRADVWSFGCVLYEMLTGRRAFDGESVADTLGAVMHQEPDWSRLPPTTPRAIRRMLRRTLQKDPARRTRHIADAAHEIYESLDEPHNEGPDPPPPLRLTTARLGAALAVFVVLAGAAVLWVSRPTGSGTVTKLIVGWPAGGTPVYSSGFALTSDGSRLAYVGPDGRLWVRDLDELEPRALAGTDEARVPFFSPDGLSVAFVASGSLKVVPVQGGSVRTVVADSLNVVDGDWAPDGMLYFSRSAQGVWRVPAAGGAAEPVSRPDAPGVTHNWVDALPNGKGAILTIGNESINTSKIGLLDLVTGDVQSLFPGAQARFATSGHVVYLTADGTLHAVPFDQSQLRLTGSPLPVIENVEVGIYSNSGSFALSNNGTLLYQRRTLQESELVWVTKNGTASPLAADRWTGDFFSLALSPDGTQLAATLTTGTRQDVWTRSLETGAMNRLTFDNDGTLNYRPKWTADGRALTYISNRSGTAGELWWQRADGSARAERLVADGPIIDEGALSPDGHWAVYRAGGSELVSRDIKAVRLGSDGAGRPQALVATRSEEYSPVLSADGRWLAYVSGESGRPEVYVRPFPNAEAAVWQVSRGGGRGPVWARNGRQLFFQNLRGELVAAATRTGATFEWDPPQVLFDASDYALNPWHPTYDVMPDGERFLMPRRVKGAEGGLVLTLNWFDEMKNKLAGR